MIDERWRSVRRVLAVRLDNLGDVLVTTPALHAIKASLPNAALTLLASAVGAQAGALNPDVDAVMVYEAPWMDPWHRLPQDSQREQRMIEQVRAGRFEGAIIFTSYHQSPLPAAYLCYLAGVPLRVAASIDGPGSLLTTRHKHPERMMHEVERGLDLVGAIGLGTDETDLVLAVPDSARRAVRRRLAGIEVAQGGGGRRLKPRLSAWRRQSPPARAGIKSARNRNCEGGPLVVVHPGCSMPARTYPEELYSEVVERLARRLGAMVLLTGMESERALAERVRGRVAAPVQERVHIVAGALDFAELAALLEAADLVITNNTGPMHVAAAVKTPVIALFALTNPPEQWGPWHVPHRLLYADVPCRLCYSRVCPYSQECLRLVTPEMVVDAAAEILAEDEVQHGGNEGNGGERRKDGERWKGIGRGGPARRPAIETAPRGVPPQSPPAGAGNRGENPANCVGALPAAPAVQMPQIADARCTSHMGMASNIRKEVGV